MKSGDAGGDMPTVAEATIEEQADTSGRIKITNTEGQVSEVPISKVGERWYIGTADDHGAGLMSTLGLSDLSGAENAQMTPEMRRMAMQMMAAG